MTTEQRIHAEIARRERVADERRRWREDERTPGTEAHACAARLREPTWKDEAPTLAGAMATAGTEQVRLDPKAML
jgi:hypothetical protein